MVMALERFLAKHVEMNHHARLVLFLRAQNVITELEAEEYLEPSGARRGASALAAAEHAGAPRGARGLVAHAVTLGVLLLMLGLIHVAPLGATPKTSTVTVTEKLAHYRVRAFPWAKVSIDGKLVATTPAEKALDDRGRQARRAVRARGLRADREAARVRGSARPTTRRRWWTSTSRRKARCSRARRGKPRRQRRRRAPTDAPIEVSGDRSARHSRSSRSSRSSRRGSRAPTTDDGGVRIHKVKAGDTFELLAAEYYEDRNDAVFLLVANHLKHPRKLVAGEKIRVPGRRARS